MPTWTLGTLCSEVTAQLGNRLDIPLSRVSFFVNEAGRMVWDAELHARAEAIAVSSTTSGENRIALPSDFQDIVNLSNISTSPPAILRQMNASDFDSASTSGAAPRMFMQYASWLELYPSPDSSYSMQLRYRTQWSDMTILTAQPSVATRYHQAIMLKAIELTAEGVLDSANASRAAERYAMYMGVTPNDYALRQRARDGMAVQIGNRPVGNLSPRYRGPDFDHRDF